MKYVDEFRSRRLIDELAKKIRQADSGKPLKIMEVCGTHTQSFFRFGLDKLLPENIELISGPGCPVCVSSAGYIDSAIGLSKNKNTLIATFGDMFKVPGSASSLIQARAEGAKVSLVYSPLESLQLAKRYRDKKIIFLAVGFETTAPTVALTILAAKKEKLSNIFFLTALKLIPPAMRYLLEDKTLRLNAFLCPGHVSAIIGTNPYEFIVKKYKLPCCVAGFEPLDILEGIYCITRQINLGHTRVDNQYGRVVRKHGNPKALRAIRRVFSLEDSYWRGLGKIKESGLRIKKEFSSFDAQKEFSLSLKEPSLPQNKKCRCAQVLKGMIRPDQCSLFYKACNPLNPLGACMVSQEGACNAYYRYRRKIKF